MTREIIEDYRKIILPFMKKKLLEINYENQGESDADEFEKDFNEILDLAAKALKQESVLDKIRDEIDRQQEWLVQAGHNAYDVEIAFDIIKAILTESED